MTKGAATRDGNAADFPSGRKICSASTSKLCGHAASDWLLACNWLILKWSTRGFAKSSKFPYIHLQNYSIYLVVVITAVWKPNCQGVNKLLSLTSHPNKWRASLFSACYKCIYNWNPAKDRLIALVSKSQQLQAFHAGGWIKNRNLDAFIGTFPNKIYLSHPAWCHMPRICKKEIFHCQSQIPAPTEPLPAGLSVGSWEVANRFDQGRAWLLVLYPWMYT